MTADEENARGKEFVIAHRFMWRDLSLSGVTLLVYARIYGFCRDGGGFYESRASTAEFLGTTPRTVTRAIDELLAAGLIREAGSHETGTGRKTRCYVLAGASPPEDPHDDASPDEPSPDETSPQASASPDKRSGEAALNPDGSSGLPVTGCHPIRKVDNKWF